jgi:outer membrane receptor for ferrienterochelin and colicin
MKRISELIVFTAFISMAWAQTAGKISGKVLGDDGSQLFGANIIVLGTGSGASAASDGAFKILNIPAGSYTVKASFIGYSAQEVSGVRVVTGFNTEINFSLTPSAVEGAVIQVNAERTLIQKDETSSINLVTREELENMPIRSLDGVLATMPGVVVQNNDVHIRGGRSNEVAYFLNGSSTTNLGNRENLVYVPQEAIEELQVQVGGYDAEVSGANSGVVKRSLRRGSTEFSGSFSLRSDGGEAGSSTVGGGYSYGHSTALASISGPILGESLKFFVAFEQSKEEDPYVKVS